MIKNINDLITLIVLIIIAFLSFRFFIGSLFGFRNEGETSTDRKKLLKDYLNNEED